MNDYTKDRIGELKSLVQKMKVINEERDVDLDNFILRVKEDIRRQELDARAKSLFDDNYFFGYLALQSQLIEEDVRSIITTAKECIDKIDVDDPSSTLVKELQTKPLGALIKELFKYIEYPKLNDLLSDFNSNRTKTVHHLIQEIHTPLDNFEQDIKSDYKPDKIQEIINSLLEVHRRIFNRLPENPDHTSEQKKVMTNLEELLEQEIDLTDEDIDLKF